MRYLLNLFGFLILLVACFCFGCSIGSKLGKGDQPPTDPKTQTQAAQDTTKSMEKPPGATDDELKKLLEPPPTPQQLQSKSLQPKKAEGELTIDLNDKEEVNRHAIDFAKQIPNVKHIKTCFSKIYGGWYMLLYIQKGKKVALDQYSWSPVTKEWEIIYRLKEIPAKQLEAHVKGEVGDEKCFVLK